MKRFEVRKGTEIYTADGTVFRITDTDSDTGRAWAVEYGYNLESNEFNVEIGTVILTTSDIARHLHAYDGDSYAVSIDD